MPVRPALPDALAPRRRHPRRARRRAGLAALAITAVAALLGAGLDISSASAATAVMPSGGTAAAATASPSVTPGVSPRTYYVDCSRRIGGDGTIAHPWNRVARINTHHWYAPGERILLKRGTTCRGRITPSGSGTTKLKNVLGAYGKGTRPVVAGGGTPNGTGTVQLTDVSNWTVQDLHLTNATAAGTRTYRSALLLLNKGYRTLRMRNITVQRLLVDHVTSNPTSHHNDARAFGGISALTPDGTGDGFDDLRILHNRIRGDSDPARGVGRTGIVVKNRQYPRSADRNVRIAYNDVRWARGDSIVLVGARHGRVDHNVSAHGAAFWPCSQCTGISPETANAGIWTAASDRVVIEHNEVYGEHRLGGDGEAFDVDRSSTRAVVQYNYAHGNEGGGVLVCAARDARIRFNILQNNGRAAIFFTCHLMARNISIYNNTIVNKRGVSSYIVKHYWHKAVGLRFFNNLVYNHGSGRYLWPSKPRTAANTFVGVHAASEPKGPGVSHRSTNLRDPGRGGVGMGSLSGYRVRSIRHAERGIPIPSSVKVDFFGRKVNAKHPIRGAASS